MVAFVIILQGNIEKNINTDDIVFLRFSGFGFRRQGQGDNKPTSPPVVIDLGIGLKEAFKGTILDVDIDKQVLCPACNGLGAKSENDINTCSNCGGSGVKVVQQVIMGAFIQHSQST